MAKEHTDAEIDDFLRMYVAYQRLIIKEKTEFADSLPGDDESGLSDWGQFEEGLLRGLSKRKETEPVDCELTSGRKRPKTNATIQKAIEMKNKRTHPKESTRILKSWILLHKDNPFPTSAEKEALSQESGLTVQQINYWMTNARRRLLKPDDK